jgi:DNA-binding transcriptional MocR family regulator
LSHIRLQPIPGDGSGMMPDELEKACRSGGVRGVFLMPNCANPTTCTIPETRKDQLADIIARYKLILIEDDNTGILPAQDGSYKSFFSRLPEQTVYICNSTMALCNGLRVAFAAFPEAFRNQLLNALFYLNIKTSSLDAEITTELILSGKAAKLLEQKAMLARQRNELFDRIFPDAVKPGTPAAFFRWLPIPHLPMGQIELERQLRQRGVNCYCSYRFSPLRNPEDFIRLAISSPESQESLEQGLRIIADYLAEHQ